MLDGVTYLYLVYSTPRGDMTCVMSLCHAVSRCLESVPLGEVG